MLNKDGTFDFLSSYTSDTGTLTTSSPNGDVAISTLDANGNVVDTVWLNSDYAANVNYMQGTKNVSAVIDTGTMPVVVSFPLNSNAESIQVAQAGKVISKSSIKGQQLQGIVSRIPDSAFKTWEDCFRDPRRSNDAVRVSKLISHDRKFLNKIVSSIQKSVNSNKIKQALLELRELEIQIEVLTKRNYTVTDDWSLAQAQVISQINDIIESLEQALKNTKCYDKKIDKK